MSELYHISSLRRTNHLFGSSPILLWAAEPLRPLRGFVTTRGQSPSFAALELNQLIGSARRRRMGVTWKSPAPRPFLLRRGATQPPAKIRGPAKRKNMTT